MSFNRLRYDNCAYEHQLSESVGTLAYILDPMRYENCNKCRIEYGVVGGTNVSHVKGNLVDLESDLLGTTRLNSRCPTFKYQSPCPTGDMTTCQPSNIYIRGSPTTQARSIDTSLQHLQPCNMFRYRPMPLPPQITQVMCGSNNTPKPTM